ncbi:hypothetical protein JQC92_02605 [Shewanella sp. 202IG2-18]|nr:hypothetical protein [Parashewanella hymeniacidonis]
MDKVQISFWLYYPTLESMLNYFSIGVALTTLHFIICLKMNIFKRKTSHFRFVGFFFATALVWPLLFYAWPVFLKKYYKQRKQSTET